MSAYTRQKAESKYRHRIRLERASQEQSNGTIKAPKGRVKQCRERKRMNAAEQINDGSNTSAVGSISNEAIVSFDILATIKWYRIQFPIAPPYAIKIPRSHVRSNRVPILQIAAKPTSLCGFELRHIVRWPFYMTNTQNDYKFCHGFGQASPTVRELRDEYQRWAQHPLFQHLSPK
ncbi:hypothetical protein TNCT_347211 [Trichonephila clavata]|uniref:Uncharacterized protein n=1 Tax=Trichonephila clavata TaxID=2740835 RepID=A0A8X6G709_TRICU|nr:hypothetical protein TNCT_347211 [Trichonephila clavata]